MIPKQKPVRSTALRKSAMGKDCTLRIPGFCNGDPATVILAHPPIANGGMSMKGSDSDGAFACSECHDVLDGRGAHAFNRAEIYECWIRGAQETRAIWRELGLLSVKGEKAA